ncbi:ATP-binding cassette domain-containing protein [Streptomyces sp. NBC_01387]|uniref:ATP-binding cassette domain-containing protein n=1 Tax=unclassified Streptomyces TaxID=2593676 RepID=UPI002023C56B|nr:MULTISPECIES: ATP-binding cassette domain-containing protein [unclassified Streptomyces]MCX4547581.1 ATP-binding cassette domain-containing protein [Streptomyces sp. NBC_01500]WSC19268.1 ATP-binding cassette domain-containing protein [Streptomyces sp. NBC_01766]WSV53291.1 ATP-binding cassette domain-containing protein [Streptomyces sp. NBC_01014]
MTYAFETEGLVKRYGKVTALNGLDLKARPGTVLGVLGPNGAGKTTAVRVLASLIKPDAGTARVAGYDVQQYPHDVRRLIGLTGQYAAVDQELTGIQNIVMVARLLGMSRPASKRRAAELLERFGLSDAGSRKARTYSGGMRRRLDLAVSLVGDPSVLFLDEPTTGLDPESRFELWDIVRDLVTGGSTVLLTTQYLDEVDHLADDIVVIDKGVSIAAGTSAELKAKIDQQTLEIQPADENMLDRTSEIVEELSGVKPNRQGHQLILQVNDAGLPAAVLRRLDEAGIEVTELALRQPSLDEVFLSLTGSRGRHVQENPAESTKSGVA